MAKALARAGVASRREVERLISAGRVALNGRVLDTPAVKVGPGDLLTVDGALVGEAEPTRVWRYHKPTGLVTTHRDPKGRPTVFEHLPEDLPRVISVGRLDLNSEGLLLLTNDGGLARALELPSNGLVRRYRARARGHTTQARLDELKQGLTVEGVHYGPIEASLDKAKEGGLGANLWITLTLTEGKNREVRKVLEALGLTVNRLIRLSYGPFQLGALEVGAVEEVGPRVIREQLAAHIDPAALPSASTPAAAAGARVRADAHIQRARAKAHVESARADGHGERPRADAHGARGRTEKAGPSRGARRGSAAGSHPAASASEPRRERPPGRAKTAPLAKARAGAGDGAASARTETTGKPDYRPGWAKPKKRVTHAAGKASRPGKDAARPRSPGGQEADRPPGRRPGGARTPTKPPPSPGAPKPRR